MSFYRHEFSQGEDYQVDLVLPKDDHGALIDTTGWTGASAIRTLDDATPLDSSGQAIAFTLTFPTAGIARFALPYNKTAQLPAKRLLYDAIVLDASGKRSYRYEGDVLVKKSFSVIGTTPTTQTAFYQFGLILLPV